MGSLGKQKIEVLCDFARIATEQGLRHVVIGAGARVLACELVDLKLGRMTDDWDLAVPVKDWATYATFTARLAEVPGAPFQRTQVEHRFRHASTAIPLDLVPFGGVEQEPGLLVWPKSQQEMNVQGIDVALSTSEQVRFGSVDIHFASLPSQACQKAAAYLDRRERGVIHDLADFVWVLTVYEDYGNTSRVFDEAWDTLRDSDVESWAQGAALLGQDLRGFGRELLLPVRATLEELNTPDSLAQEHVRPRYDPDGGEKALADIRELARATLCGLDATT